MDPIELIENAIILLFGAYILYVIAQALTTSEPGFGNYAWAIVGAFVIGVVAYLKYRR